MLKITLNAKKEEMRTNTRIITDAIMKLIYRHSLPPRSYLSVFVDGKMVAKTVFKQNIEFETDKYGCELYVKRFIFKTNKIQTPNSDGEYYITWKQNYLYLLVYVVLIFLPGLKYVIFEVHEDYLALIYLILLIAITNAIWGEFLILGRKIEIKPKSEL